MKVEPVIGQRIAGVVSAIMGEQFRTHEDLARQLESIAAMARAYHSQEMAQRSVLPPSEVDDETSISG